jgi:hypothetical protein
VTTLLARIQDRLSTKALLPGREERAVMIVPTADAALR